MPQCYAASYVPTMRDTGVLVWNPNSRRKPRKVATDAFGLIAQMEKGDRLFLMMGSTNAAVALGAFRRRVRVYQISYLRAASLLAGEGEQEGERNGGRRMSPEDVLSLAQRHEDGFYALYPRQAGVLEIAAAWEAVDTAMEARKAYANQVRARLTYEAVVWGRVGGREIGTKEELKEISDARVGTKDAETGAKVVPGDSHMARLLEDEQRARAELDRICKGSEFFGYVFGNVDGVGPMLAARFISAIEQIERFAEPKDLSNYAGMLPRGQEGALPSRARSRGKSLGRDSLLNNACFLLQNQMFQWGRNTPLGQRITAQIERECPCTQERRKGDADLRKKHAEAVKRARIAMTRHFLELVVWPRWRAFMEAPS